MVVFPPEGEVYLRAYESVSEARTSIGHYLDFYNGRLDLPRFRGGLRAWDQDIWSGGSLPSYLVASDAARPRRRRYRIKSCFAAVHESGYGTQETVSPSAGGSVPEVLRTRFARGEFVSR
jgi:hypothetical protein